MSLLSDIESLLHNVSMSQICLADMIHDCRTVPEVARRRALRVKYEMIYELETDLRTWRSRILEAAEDVC